MAKFKKYVFDLVLKDKPLGPVDKYTDRYVPLKEAMKLEENSYITYHEDLTENYVYNNINYPHWDWNVFFERFNIDFYDFIDICKEYGHDNLFHPLSYHPDLIMDFVIENRKEKWDWFKITEHLKTVDDFNLFIDLKDEEWNWRIIGKTGHDLPEEMKRKIVEIVKDKTKDRYFATTYYTNLVDNDEFLKTSRYTWCYDLSKRVFTMEQISKNIKTMDTTMMEHITSQKDLAMDIVLSNKNRNWDYEELSSHPNLTFDVVVELKDKKWDWEKVIENTKPPLEKILELTVVPLFIYEKLSLYPDMTGDIWMKLMAKISYNHYARDRIYEYIFDNENIKIEDLIKIAKNYSRTIRKLSRHRNLTIDLVKKYKDDDIWNYDIIWNRFCHDTDAILRTSEMWSMRYISENLKLTLKDILKYPDINWDFRSLSKNENLDFDIVIHFRDKNWDFYELSKNENITLKCVTALPEKDWDWNEIKMNPFIIDRKIFEAREKIKEWMESILSSPEYVVGLRHIKYTIDKNSN